MEEYLPLIIQLVSGAVGGNVAGKILKNLSLGTLGNTIAGILGGGLGGWIFEMWGLPGGEMAEASTGLPLPTILGSMAGGSLGGGVLMALAGLLKKANKK